MSGWSTARATALAGACAEAQGWPLPGRGATADRYRRLADCSRGDLVVGRLVEAHADAVAILTELDGPPVQPGERWGVWAAGDPASVSARADGDGWRLSGHRDWCSGATLLTHALVVAEAGGEHRLYAVALADPAVNPDQPGWIGAGMAACDTRTVRFGGAPAVPVGAEGAYLRRPGFWIGAIGVAACWHGGTTAVAERLRSGTREKMRPHVLAHLGRVGALVAQGAAVLAAAGAEIDADPLGDHERRALAVRSIIAEAATEVIDRTGRALGPGPLAHDGRHSALVADLAVYVRQDHAEADLERLGRRLLDAGEGW